MMTNLLPLHDTTTIATRALARYEQDCTFPEVLEAGAWADVDHRAQRVVVRTSRAPVRAYTFRVDTLGRVMFTTVEITDADHAW